jgi:mono/diheme cytochrome c family protein
MRTHKSALNEASSVKSEVGAVQTSGFGLTPSPYAKTLICLAILIGAAATVLAFPWTRDMVRGRAVKPQTLMLVPPPNTLAIGHPRILERDEADKQLANPLSASAPVLEQGRALFATNCAVCHGVNGRGGGPVGKYFRAIPDLSGGAVQAYSDGLLYSVIREGGFNMPAYAEALSPQERWAVVHFLRTLRRSS